MDTYGYQLPGRDVGASGGEITDEQVQLTMQTLVKSMQKHLSGVTDKLAPDRSRRLATGSESQGQFTRESGGGGNINRKTGLDSSIQGYLESPRSSYGRTSSWLQTQGHSTNLSHSYSGPSNHGYNQDDASYPSLATPFYTRLRQKYPRAFRRQRRHSDFSAASDVGSVDDVTAAMMSSSSRRCQSACTTPRGGARDDGDMGIVGLPRPRSRPPGGGPLASSRHGSMVSLCSDVSVMSASDRSQRNASMDALRGRLDRNQRSWDQLLKADPLAKLRGRRAGTKISTSTPRDAEFSTSTPRDPGFSTSTPRGPMDPHALDRLLELEQALDRLENEDRRAAKPPPHARKPPPAHRRFASPDSHDSAVEMDSASNPSLSSASTNRNIGSTNGIPVHGIPQHAPNGHVAANGHVLSDTDGPRSPRDATLPPPASRPSRARSRTPKLRSRGSSPLLLRDGSTSKHRSADNQHRSADNRVRSPETPTRGYSRREGAYNKDSDADSGIFQSANRPPVPMDTEVSSSADDDVVYGSARGHRHRERSIDCEDSRSKSSDRSKVKFKDEVPRGRTASGVLYEDVMAEYGSPPGFDNELFSEVSSHSRSKSRSGLAPGPLSMNSKPRPKPQPKPQLQPKPHIEESHTVTAPPRTKHKQRQFSESDVPSNLQKSPSMTSLASQTSLLDDVDFDRRPSAKKSKLPWRRGSKGKFTPSKEMEKLQQQMLGDAGSRTSLVSLPSDKHDKIGQAHPIVLQGREVEVGGQPSKKPPPAPKPKHLQRADSPPNEYPAQHKPPLPKKPAPVQESSDDDDDDYNSDEWEDEEAIEPSYATAADLSILRHQPNSAQPGTRTSGYEDVELRRSRSDDVRRSQHRHSGYDDVRRSTVSENPYETIDAGERIPEMGSDEELDYNPRDARRHSEGANDREGTEQPAYQYSSIDYSKKTQHPPDEEDEPVQYINYDDDFHTDRESPPLPDRGYRSQEKGSVFNRMDSLKRSAKKKFSKLKKSMSMEKVDNSDQSTPFKRSPSLKSLTESFGFVKKIRERKNSSSKGSDTAAGDHRKPPRAPAGYSKKNPPSISLPREVVDTPTHFRPIGNVRSVNADGSQVIELNKPPHGPFGFYIARGNAACNHAVLVSRLSDGLPDHFFAGLLSVGDEILEINRRRVAEMSLEDVYELMASEDRLLLNVMPYTLRREL